MNIKFSELEMQQLIQKYKMTNGLINYYDFVANIESVFYDGANPMAVINNAKSSANFENLDLNVLLDLLQAIKIEII